MKTADLVVGDDYLVSSSDDWLTRGQRPERRRILDTGKWLRRMYYTAADRFHTERLEDGTTVSVREQINRRLNSGRSDGVLTVRIDDDGNPMTFPSGEQQIDVTPPRDIRGPWEEALAIRERNIAHAKEKADRARAERQEFRARKEAALRDLGVNEITPFNNKAVSITLDDLEAILSALVGIPGVEFPITDRKDS